jgi:hypothetical protein
MSVPEQEMSLRPGRLEYKRLLWALLISVIFHAMCYGGYEFSRTVLPVWMRQVKMLAALAERLQKKPTPPPQPQESVQVPLMFVDVNPDIATPEPPKDAKFYSAKNSKAANPDIADNDIPKITGRQEVVAKAEDVPHTPAPLTPSRAQPEAQKGKEEQEPQKERPKPPVGDLAMAKPEPKPQPDTGQDEQTRPRTIVAAKMREQQRNQITGEKMKQDGGVQRRSLNPSFDARATSFGVYDQQLIDAIKQRWDDLLESRQFALDRTGKVVIEFTLHHDGRVSDVTIAETTVGDTLAYVCRLAVTDPAPYMAWPSDMRRQLGESHRIKFTFNYLY